MRPLRNFEEFIKEGIVKSQRADLSRANDLLQEAEKRKSFLKDMLDKIGISDKNANYFVENSYDTLMESIRAKMLIDGFKAAGLNAHEAEVSYLRLLNFSESDVMFANELRYFRNGIVYYGRSMDAEYANKSIEFLNNLYPMLEKLARKNIGQEKKTSESASEKQADKKEARKSSETDEEM